MNVALHAANAVLLLVVLRLMTGAFWPGLFVAALFAVHPLRVESVAWAAERKDVLAGLFFMLTMLAYTLYARRPRSGRYVLVLSCLALGLMAKPMLVTLPCVLLLLDFWPLGRLGRRGSPAGAAGAGTRPLGRLLLEKLPLLALATASSLATVVCQRAGGAMAPVEDLAGGSLWTNVPLAYVAYLWKTLWPVKLAVFYPHPALVAGVAPSVLAVRALALAGGAALAATAWVQVGHWKDEVALYRHAPDVTSDNYLAHNNLGVALKRRGNLAAAEVHFRRAAALDPARADAHNNLGLVLARQGRAAEAEAEYREALRLDPDHDEARDNLRSLLTEDARGPAGSWPTSDSGEPAR